MDRPLDDSYIHQEPSDGKMRGVKMAIVNKWRETRYEGRTCDSK